MARMTATTLLEQWVEKCEPIWTGNSWRANGGGHHTCPFCNTGSGFSYKYRISMDDLPHPEDCFYIESKRFLQKAKERKDKRKNIK